jgi:hypothetical protein
VRCTLVGQHLLNRGCDLFTHGPFDLVHYFAARRLRTESPAGPMTSSKSGAIGKTL